MYLPCVVVKPLWTSTCWSVATLLGGAFRRMLYEKMCPATRCDVRFHREALAKRKMERSGKVENDAIQAMHALYVDNAFNGFERGSW